MTSKKYLHEKAEKIRTRLTEDEHALEKEQEEDDGEEEEEE